jgi:hypothetical protein
MRWVAAAKLSSVSGSSGCARRWRSYLQDGEGGGGLAAVNLAGEWSSAGGGTEREKSEVAGGCGLSR